MEQELITLVNDAKQGSVRAFTSLYNKFKSDKDHEFCFLNKQKKLKKNHFIGKFYKHFFIGNFYKISFL